MRGLAVIIRFSAWLLLASVLVSCSADSDRATRSQVRNAVATLSTTLQETAIPQDDCGLAAYPASRSNENILADAPRSGRPTSSMMAKVRVDAGGRVTHLRLIRRAYPEAPKVGDGVTLKAIQELKERRFDVASGEGMARPQCVDVTTTIDLR
jgi:hypothetical protein